MLNKKEVKEIREHLERAQNPIFFFDNDSDGLCSFLLLQRYIGRGKGVCIKSFPFLEKSYFHKVRELNSDYIFILDKPEVSQDFLEEASKLNLPVVWIDHHEIDRDLVPKFVYYYNPIFSSGDNAPVTTLCYQVSNKKEDLWIAVAGAIADCYLPDYYAEFEKRYPDLSVKAKKAFDVLYNSEIGKLSAIINAGLKDTTTNVVSMLKFLIKAKTPYEVLEETPKNHLMHKRFKEIEGKYNLLLDKAKQKAGKDKILFFKYSGNLKVNGELANQLSYLFPKKIIIVAYVGDAKVNLSIRGEDILPIFEKVILNFKEAHGGGHQNSVGGQLHVKDLDKFISLMKQEIN